MGGQEKQKDRQKKRAKSEKDLFQEIPEDDDCSKEAEPVPEGRFEAEGAGEDGAAEGTLHQGQVPRQDEEVPLRADVALLEEQGLLPLRRATGEAGVRNGAGQAEGDPGEEGGLAHAQGAEEEAGSSQAGASGSVQSGGAETAVSSAKADEGDKRMKFD